MGRKKPDIGRLLEDFFLYLKEKNLKEKTINRHLYNIEFYITIYLNRENIHPIDSSEEEIIYYLGNWYIRKVMNSKKSDVVPILTSFKKFYKFLYDKGYIGKDRYTEILKVCKAQRQFQGRFDSYQNIDFDKPDGEGSWVDWMENLDFIDNYDEEDLDRTDFIQEIINSEHFQLFQNGLPDSIRSLDTLPEKTMAFLNDFLMFLNYCEENAGMKVSKSHLSIQRKHLMKINEQLSSPETLKPNFFQWDALLINFFYHLAKVLNCIYIDNKFSLQVTKSIKKFRSLTPLNQLLLCILILWEKIKWAEFLEPNAGGRPEWAQDARYLIIHGLLHFTPNHKYQYKSLFTFFSGNSLGHNDFFWDAIFGWGVVPTNIMPYLESMGLISLTYSVSEGYRNIKHISISEFGKDIFLGLIKIEDLVKKELELAEKRHQEKIQRINDILNKLLDS